MAHTEFKWLGRNELAGVDWATPGIPVVRETLAVAENLSAPWKDGTP